MKEINIGGIMILFIFAFEDILGLQSNKEIDIGVSLGCFRSHGQEKFWNRIYDSNEIFSVLLSVKKYDIKSFILFTYYSPIKTNYRNRDDPISMGYWIEILEFQIIPKALFLWNYKKISLDIGYGIIIAEGILDCSDSAIFLFTFSFLISNSTL